VISRDIQPSKPPRSQAAHAADVLARFPDARRTGPDTYRDNCPACGGTSRNKLSIKQRADGGWLLHCFAGCVVDDVTRAAGLELSDLFPPNLDPHTPTKGERRPWPVRVIVEAFIGELRVAWVLLSDLASGKEATEADRVAAGIARDRIAAAIQELQR
jgi:hypothetical protein